MADELQTGVTGPSVTDPAPVVTTPAPEPVPTWDEVAKSPEFQDASHAAKLVTFTRWHDAAYNEASKLPDWKQFEGQFNTEAANRQKELTNEGGFTDLNHAKVQLATEALHQHLGELKADAITQGQPEPTGLSGQQTRDALKNLGEDVYSAYFQATPEEKAGLPPVTAGDTVAQGLGSALSEIGQGVGSTLSAVGYLGGKVNVLNKVIGSGLEQLGVDPDTVTAVKGYNPIQDLGEQLKKSSRENKYIDPRLQGSVSDIVGSSAGQIGDVILESYFGSELFKGLGLVQKTGIVGGKTVLAPRATQIAAEKLAQKVAVTGVFAAKGGEAGKETGENAHADERKILQSFLVGSVAGAATAQLSPASKWIDRMNEATGGGFGRTIKNAVLEGGQNALQMLGQTVANDANYRLILHQHPEILKDMQEAAGSGGTVGFVTSFLLSLAGGKRAFVARPRPLAEIAPEAAPAVEKAKETAPKVAAAAETAVRESAATSITPAPAAGPEVSVAVTHNRDGSESVTVNNTEAATPEQLTAMKAEIDKSELQPEQKAQVQTQLDQAIVAKQKAALGTPENPIVGNTAAPLTEVLPQNSNPNDFTPAVRTATGEKIVGEKGQGHDDFKIPAALAAEATPERASAILDAEHGFVDPSGNFFSRDVTARALGEDRPLTAQRLSELQAKPASNIIPLPPTKAEPVAAAATPVAAQTAKLTTDEAGNSYVEVTGNVDFEAAKTLLQRTRDTGKMPTEKEILHAAPDPGEWQDTFRKALAKHVPPENIIQLPVAAPKAVADNIRAVTGELKPAPAPRPLAPVAREETVPAPTEQEIKNQVLKARTPEEKTAAVQASQDREVRLALESGQEPRLNDIAGRQGSREKVQETREAVRAALAAKYPPETVPAGSKEITLHNEVTGDKLPQIVEPKLDENGEPVPNTTVTRPKFTNDADFTAQELAKGSTVLLPEDFKIADVNPAIHVETQADGTRKVVSVETRYGTVDGPEGNPERGTVDYNAAYKADVGTGKAHKVIAMGDTAAHISDLNQAVGQELAQRGIASDALERFDTDNPDPTLVESSATRGKDANPVKVRDNFTVLDLLGIPPGDRAPAPLRRALEKIAASDKFPAALRDQARKLIATGHDFESIKIRRTQDTGTNAAGWWDPNTRTITVNLAAGHEGGVANTILHEVAHDIIHDNFINPKNDVHKNAANLTRRIQQTLLRAAFKESVGRDAANVSELSDWAAVQRAKDVREGNPFTQYEDRKYYGVAHPEELLATVGTEAPIRELAAKLPPLDAPGPKPKTLLQQLYDAARRLFTGGKKEPESAFDQLMQSFADLSVRDNAEATGGNIGPPLAAKSADNLETLDRAGLEDRWVKAGNSLEDSYSMTTNEIRDALRGGEVVPDSGKIERSGWLGPDGKFTEADGGNHYATALSAKMSAQYPKFGAALKTFMQDLGHEPQLNEMYQFMEDHGFARIAHGGTEIYAQGKLTNTQRRILKDAAIEQDVPAYHDFGGPRIGKIFEPAAIFNKAATDKAATADKEDLPSADPNAVRVQTVVGPNGKVSRNLHISEDATRADLLAMKDTLPNIKGLSEADLTRMNEVIDSQIGPTTVLQTGKIAGSGAAGQRIAYGYDSSGNIANIRGNQKGNDVAVDFGPLSRPSRLNRTKAAGDTRAAYDAAIADRTAMPFVIEAGGDRHQLEIMLDQVANAKEPAPEGVYQKFKARLRAAAGRPAPTLAEQYTPIVQHALDNFDRLNGKTANFKSIMKEQLERERGVGISVGDMDNYVTRLLKTPGSEDKLGVASSATGGSRYFIKGRRFETLADAINKGYRPITEGSGNATDIAELAHRRVESGERLVQQKLLENQLRNLVLPDGNPILGANEYYEATSGKTEHRIPAGYRTVQTGGAPLVVHNSVAPVFEALYGQGSIPGFIKSTAGFLKRNTLVADTFHVGRIIAKELGYSGGKERVGYNKGLALLEYDNKTLDRAVAVGEINQKQADYARANRPIAELLIKNGLNVGRVADNLAAQHAASIPGLKGFNPWVFQKLSRGAMLQTAIHNYERNLSRFGGDSEKAARQTAVEYNEVFGNLQNQSIFKNKRFQDASRAIILAPNWAESQFFAELRGYGQLLQAPVDIAKGVRAGEGLASLNRVGTVARGQATVVLGMLAANQVINYLFTGHSTFENKDGHYFDAFIPHANIFGGKQGRGFYLNPMEIAAEYAHMAHRYMSQHITPVDALVQIAENKLGPLGRSAHDLFSGTDYAGKSYATTGDRVRAALVDALPFPIGLTSVLERDPRSPLLFRPTRQVGAGERQLLQSAGLKTTAELSPRSEIYALAHPFRPDKGYRDNAPAEYRELRSALDNEQPDNAMREIQLLLDRGHTLDNIRQAAPFTPEKFTGSDKQETLFRKSLTPDQMDLYKQAQADHRANAAKLTRLLGQITPEQRKQSLANKR